MAEDESDKTHVLMMDCIISEFGRCEAGYMLSEADVSAGTWTWLKNQGFLKSVEDIEQEADSEPTAPETTKTPVVRKTRSVKKSIKAETKNTQVLANVADADDKQTDNQELSDDRGVNSDG